MSFDNSIIARLPLRFDIATVLVLHAIAERVGRMMDLLVKINKIFEMKSKVGTSTSSSYMRLKKEIFINVKTMIMCDFTDGSLKRRVAMASSDFEVEFQAVRELENV